MTTFNTMNEAMSKLRSGQVNFDVFFPTVDGLGQLMDGKLIQPLNHSYIPNMAQAWPDFSNPFYDRAGNTRRRTRSTPPGWPGARTRRRTRTRWPTRGPCRGRRKYKGKVAVLDDYRETISLALLQAGNFNLNTTSTAQIPAAGKALQEAVEPDERADRQQRLHRRPDRQDVDSPRLVGRHGSVLPIPAQGRERRRPRLLVPARTEGPGGQRPDGHPHRRARTRCLLTCSWTTCSTSTTRSRTTATWVTCSR